VQPCVIYTEIEECDICCLHCRPAGEQLSVAPAEFLYLSWVRFSFRHDHHHHHHHHSSPLSSPSFITSSVVIFVIIIIIIILLSFPSSFCHNVRSSKLPYTVCE